MEPQPDHKTFIANLSTTERLALNEKQDKAGLLHLAGHGVFLLFCGFWIMQGWLGWQGVMLFYGIALTFLFTLEHEATHRTPFKSLWLNETVGRFCGVLLCLPFEWFRYFHFAHHRWTNIPGQDPELAGEKPQTMKQYLLHISGLPYWWSMGRQIITNATGGDQGTFIPPSAQKRIRLESQIHLLMYGIAVASLFWSSTLFWLWFLPCLLGQPFLRLYLMAEHGDCAFVPNMFENTRTIYTNGIVRFFAWNMPFHTEHHAMPQVPFHKLPALNAKMLGHHSVTAPSYSSFTKDYVAELEKP